MTTITRLRGRTSLALSLIAALALAVPVQRARADSNPNPGILPPHSQAYGKTYGGWSAVWWQRVLAIPAHDQNGQILNPLLDDTGARCGVGQAGPIWFLAGSLTGSAVRDQCTVPAGKALFFPLVNIADFHVPCNGQNSDVCDSQDTPQLLWNDLENNFGFRIISTTASIDGVQVSNLNPANTPYRTCAGPAEDGCTAPAFSVTLPADNAYGFPLPAGTYSPTVADGAYLLLAPLVPGTHTITFGGTGSLFGGQVTFSQDITYNLVVSSS
jgi:hypothetical protein